jgi:hypothetical protein
MYHVRLVYPSRVNCRLQTIMLPEAHLSNRHHAPNGLRGWIITSGMAEVMNTILKIISERNPD